MTARRQLEAERCESARRSVHAVADIDDEVIENRRGRHRRLHRCVVPSHRKTPADPPQRDAAETAPRGVNLLALAGPALPLATPG